MRDVQGRAQGEIKLGGLTSLASRAISVLAADVSIHHAWCLATRPAVSWM